MVGHTQSQPLLRHRAADELAQTLKDARVHTKACARLDDFDRIHTAHREHLKGQLKLAIGAAGLVLGTIPGIPGMYTTCRDDGGWLCALRIGALVGSVAALGVTIWSAYDASFNAVRLDREVERLSQEMARAMLCRTGHAPVEDLFLRYRHMSRDERTAFKALLHEAAKEPKALSRWRQVADAVGV